MHASDLSALVQQVNGNFHFLVVSYLMCGQVFTENDSKRIKREIRDTILQKIIINLTG